MTARAYDTHVEQLFERVHLFHRVLTEARIPYRLIGGVAVFLHVSRCDPLQARLTADVDAEVDRKYLGRIVEAATKTGWVHRHVSGFDMLVDAGSPNTRSPVRLVFADGPAPLPETTKEGILLAPVADLVRMKLTSYRLKDRVHIQDMDAVGLITPEIENLLPEPLKLRLQEVRATE